MPLRSMSLKENFFYISTAHIDTDKPMNYLNLKQSLVVDYTGLIMITFRLLKTFLKFINLVYKYKFSCSRYCSYK